MANVKRVERHIAWTTSTAELMPARPFRLNYNFLSGVVESEPTPKAKSKAVLLRTIKNARIVDSTERRNEEDYKVYESLRTLCERGRMKGSLDLGSYFDGTA